MHWILTVWHWYWVEHAQISLAYCPVPLFAKAWNYLVFDDLARIALPLLPIYLVANKAIDLIEWVWSVPVTESARKTNIYGQVETTMVSEEFAPTAPAEREQTFAGPLDPELAREPLTLDSVRSILMKTNRSQSDLAQKLQPLGVRP